MPDSPLRRATISVLVDNEAGILARVVGLFLRGGERERPVQMRIRNATAPAPPEDLR